MRTGSCGENGPRGGAHVADFHQNAAMRRTLWIGIVLGVLASTARAEDPPAKGDPRAVILGVEMARGPAADLAAFVAPDADPGLRRLALRALGRIGDRAGAPELLANALEPAAPDLVTALWASGLTEAPALAATVAPLLYHEDAAVRAEAALALGRVGGPQHAAILVERLADDATGVRAATLRGVGSLAFRLLARMRTAPPSEKLSLLAIQEHFEVVVKEMTRPEPDVRAAAGFAAWALANARRELRKIEEDPWRGDFELASFLFPLLGQEDPQLRIAALRIIGPLMPPAAPEEETFARLLAVADDPDPRVVQDLLWRVLRNVTGEKVEAVVVRLLAHADPKVRQLAAEELGRRATAEAVAALAARVEKEPDARVRDAIAVELARVGKTAEALALLERDDRPDDPVLRQSTRARLLLAARAVAKEEETQPAAPPEPGEAPGAPLLDLIALARDAETHPGVVMEILEGLQQHPATGEALTALAGELLAHADPFVRAAAAALIGERKLVEHVATLDVAYAKASSPEARDVRSAVVEAWAKLGADERLTKEQRDQIRLSVLMAAQEDPSAVVRLAGREAAKTLEIPDAPTEDARTPNDWLGLPRPEGKVLGLAFPAPKRAQADPRDAWLTHEEIILLADRIASERPRVVFQTTAGSFAVEVDAERAPVHAASLVLAVHAGVYDGTRWHRVVPNFVIQGGDPHGHGAGDAGWSVPDEITDLPFERGALGMPKSTKDTGGCQVFVMHSDYGPLDGRYTCYGRVVAGMETVDRIRVGDRIETARLVLP
jgi:cyclophilin family peptidyl-prolyl cis-trans isomerase/HEAT repeat protein